MQGKKKSRSRSRQKIFRLPSPGRYPHKANSIECRTTPKKIKLNTDRNKIKIFKGKEEEIHIHTLGSPEHLNPKQFQGHNITISGH